MTHSSPLSATPASTVHCKGILFDMDGILISSLGSVERSWHIWAVSRGIDPALAIRTAHGRRAVETIRMLRPDLEELSELKFIEDMEIDDVDDIVVLPGVLRLLASLPPERWTVVTSATERLARVRLAQAGVQVPERIISAEMVERGKPHPDPFLRGAEILGFPAAECVVFEDSGAGARAGNAAGCTVIATTFSHSKKDLAAADYLITDLTQIAAQAGEDGISLRFVALPD